MLSEGTLSIVLAALISSGLASPTLVQKTNMKSLALNPTSSITVAANIAKPGLDLTKEIKNMATSKISKEEAKNIAKKALQDYFDTSFDESKYQSSINFTLDYSVGPISKSYIWQINWSYHDNQKDVNIGVSIDASTGKILNMDNMVYPIGQPPQVATLTEDQSKEIGESFLKKINPKEFSQTKLIVNNDLNNGFKGDMSSYTFYYERMANGIPFIGNYLSVIVDGVTGKVKSYSFRWNETQLPVQKGIISIDKANSLLNQNMKSSLKYIISRDIYGYGGSTPSIKLVYMPDTTNGTNLDAKTGKMLGYDNFSTTEKKTKDLDENQRKAFLSKYTPIKKLDKELDSNSAEDVMKGFIKDIYGSGYEIESTNYQDINNDFGIKSSCWIGHFVKKVSPSEQGQITIDSLTGQMISIDKYSKGDSSSSTTKPKLTWEQGYDKAINIISKYFPDKVKDISTLATYVTQPVYNNGKYETERYFSYGFNRTINGILYQDDSMNVTFDSMTGEINNIYCRWTPNLKVPSQTGIISLDSAQDIFFKKFTPHLAYAYANTSNDPNNPELGIKLVYSITDGMQYGNLYNVDAFTGKFVDYNGQEVDGDIAAFKSKIKGSPVEKELSILAAQGIISTKDFDIDKQITREDLIKMLVNTKGYRPYMLSGASDLKINYNGAKGDDTYKYLQMAVIYGIIDDSGDYKGNEIVTKEEMVKDIVRLLGYDKLAKQKDIFTLPYNDVREINLDNIGYVAISKGLGLTIDINNNFNPKNLVTMTDVAVSIYRALGNLRVSGYY